MANHDHATLVRYLSGELPAPEKAGVENHLRSCGECSEFVSFTREFRAALKQAAPELLQPGTPCPDADTLVAFEAGELDEKIAQLVRQHTIFCRDCLEELYMLRQVREAARIEEEGPGLFQKLKDKLIKLAETYGPGAMIGSIRIVAEQPAFAVRGGEPSRVPSKVLEASVGENTYTIELSFTEDGSLSCDIAGFRIARRAPLAIALRSETGELFRTQSDEYGNSHFVVPGGSIPDDLLLLTLKLGDNEKQVPFQLPERQKSA